jgi:hypothetical protein
MKQDRKRRDFLSLIGIGAAVFASGLAGCGGVASSAAAPALGASQGARPGQLMAEGFHQRTAPAAVAAHAAVWDEGPGPALGIRR